MATRPPPIQPGPFLPLTPYVSGTPNLRRPVLPYVSPQDAGGLAVSPDSVPTYSYQAAAIINGSKLINVTTESQKVIDQPNTVRNLLIIRNTDAAAVVNVEFGAPATALSAIQLQPGETILFDAVVPQDDLYLIADVACVVSVMFSNIALPT